MGTKKEQADFLIYNLFNIGGTPTEAHLRGIIQHLDWLNRYKDKRMIGYELKSKRIKKGWSHIVVRSGSNQKSKVLIKSRRFSTIYMKLDSLVAEIELSN